MKNLKINKKKIALLLASTLVLSAFSYTAIKGKDYQDQIAAVEFSLADANKQLLELIKVLDKDSITLTAVGNSISSGYSMKDKIIPLLRRNNGLLELLYENGLSYNLGSFARPEDNCDDHTFKYLISNTKQSEVDNMVRFDLIDEDASLISDDSYFTENQSIDRGLRDIIKTTNSSDMNIVIYNGCTGSFLDTITRDAKGIFSSFEKDKRAIDSFCKFVLLANPKTQVYLCGIPNYLNLGITDIINKGLMGIANRYPNITYVESSPAKLIYQNELGTTFDLHYDESEYLLHNRNIIKSICENYIRNSVCIDLHIALSILSDKIQFSHTDLKGETHIQIIMEELEKYEKLGVPKEEINSGIDRFIEIYLRNYGHDYYYTSKDKTISTLEEYKTIKKEMPKEHTRKLGTNPKL